MKDICIFPIPGSVTFPGTVFPLHVFEPRYRNMLQHCLDTGMEVAICHTEKLISEGRPTETMEEALRSNRNTYRPRVITGAGRAELQSVTDDGRMYLNIHINGRYRLVEEIQTLPFLIYRCELVPDEVAGEAEEAENSLLKDKIVHRLAALAQDNEVIPDVLSSPEWRNKSPAEFSYQLFGLIGFDPEIMQDLLETASVQQRLSLTLDLLNQVT